MKFLCLCRYNLASFAKLGPADFQEVAKVCAPHDQAMRQSGKIDVIGSLGMPGENRTLRQNASEMVEVRTGPYVDEPEPVGAFFIVEADDMESAIATAHLHPSNYLGSKFGGGIEILPVEDYWIANEQTQSQPS